LDNNHFCDSMSLFEWKGICAGFIICLYILCVVVGDPVIKRRGGGILLTGLTPPHIVPVPSQDLCHMRWWWSFCVQWVKVRGDCLFCWYWWWLLRIQVTSAPGHFGPKLNGTWSNRHLLIVNSEPMYIFFFICTLENYNFIDILVINI